MTIATPLPSSGIVNDVLAIRERWHTKNHPFFLALSEGKLPLRALGVYLAMHGQFVQRALAAFGLLYARTFTYEDVRKTIVENLAEEEGLKAIPREGHVPLDHNELILRFCKAAGLSDVEARTIRMTPAWWGRSLHYYQITAQEPIGVVLAMQSTQEGQQPALNTEVVLPALATHYGYPAGTPEIEFFTEHAEADIEHSQRQASLCAKYLDNDALKARALEVADQACRLRWASVTDLYRREYLGETEILPPGVSGDDGSSRSGLAVQPPR
jgi:pyrroloquinoline quinone (PQQ) biosynthesis protein C